jgi:hypothetical protein
VTGRPAAATRGPGADGNAMTCAGCGAALHPKPGSRRMRYCGSACRQAAYRAKKSAGRREAAGVTISRSASALPLELVGRGFRWPRAGAPKIAAIVQVIIAIEVGGDE